MPSCRSTEDPTARCRRRGMSSDLTLGAVFDGFETDTRATTPKLAGFMQRVRLLVWPPACSQPHH